MRIASNTLKILLLAGALVQANSYCADAVPPATDATGASQDALRADALLEKAVARYRKDTAKALSDFNRSKEFVDGELYVYVISNSGEMLASGGPSAALIGQNVAGLTDAEGKPFLREMLDKAQANGAGVVQYRWLNRVDNKVERKVAYFRKIDGKIIAVGFYIARASPAQAQALLGRAVDALSADPAKAIEAFNRIRGDFSEDDLYVFVVNLADNRFVAHGVDRRLVGTDALSLRDREGKPIIRQMIEAVSSKDQSELDYVWPNPVTGRSENKHTFFRKSGGMLVGVGYYTR